MIRKCNTMVAGAVTVLSVLALAGCGGEKAASPGGQPPASSTPAPSASATSAPSTSAPAVLSLGDSGIGGLALGMSKTAAKATGLVGAAIEDSSDTCQTYRGKRGIDRVYFVKGKVSIIGVGRKIRLDSGIGVGDTYTELHVKYPDAQADQDLGRISVDAPAAAVPAHYRLGIDTDGAYPESKITEIALQADDQSCYE